MGGALIGVTVTVKTSLIVLMLVEPFAVVPVGPLSVTVTVIVAVPLAPKTGVNERLPVVLALV